jgi:hypothetical protein
MEDFGKGANIPFPVLSNYYSIGIDQIQEDLQKKAE